MPARQQLTHAVEVVDALEVIDRRLAQWDGEHQPASGSEAFARVGQRLEVQTASGLGGRKVGQCPTREGLLHDALVGPGHADLARAVLERDRRVEPQSGLSGEAVGPGGEVDQPRQVEVQALQLQRGGCLEVFLGQLARVLGRRPQRLLGQRLDAIEASVHRLARPVAAAEAIVDLVDRPAHPRVEHPPRGPAHDPPQAAQEPLRGGDGRAGGHAEPPYPGGPGSDGGVGWEGA